MLPLELGDVFADGDHHGGLGVLAQHGNAGLAGSFSRRVWRSWAWLVSKQEEQFGWDLEIQSVAQVNQQPDVGGLELCKLVVRWAGRGIADVESSEFFKVVGELTDLVASRLGDETVVSQPGRFGLHPRKGLLLETFSYRARCAPRFAR